MDSSVLLSTTPQLTMLSGVLMAYYEGHCNLCGNAQPMSQ